MSIYTLNSKFTYLLDGYVEGLLICTPTTYVFLLCTQITSGMILGNSASVTFLTYTVL